MFLRKLVRYVDVQGRYAEKEVDGGLLAKEFVTFMFEDQSKNPVVRVASVLPQDGCETRLIAGTASSRARGQASGAKHRIDAFFAKTVDDTGIDVHAEGQLITRTFLNPGENGWDCTVHPQPTYADLCRSIESATERNVKLLHLAGHGTRKCGFLFNGDDAATKSAETDIRALVALLGGASGEKGPLECAVLNACSTKKLGQLLRAAGMSHVVCWRTRVQDEIAREFCRLFYLALVEQTRNGSASHRNYRDAFASATDEMRVHAFTGGAARPPPGPAAINAEGGSRECARGGREPDCNECEDMDDQENLGTDVHTVTFEDENAKDSTHSKVVEVAPWKSEDVILFLSVQGDISPIYLWRRPQTRSDLGGSAGDKVQAAKGQDWTAPTSKPENVARCTGSEMAGLWRAANDSITRSETLVAHLTSLESTKLILADASVGLRASTGGQAGGGISVIFNDTEDGPLAELKWDKWQGGEFRATTGRQLWGEKWESVLVGGSDEDKLDVVFFIAVPTIWVKSAAKVEGRALVRIIPSSLLTEYQGHHWLQKGRIVRSYILKRDAEIVME